MQALDCSDMFYNYRKTANLSVHLHSRCYRRCWRECGAIDWNGTFNDIFIFYRCVEGSFDFLNGPKFSVIVYSIVCSPESAAGFLLPVWQPKHSVLQVLWMVLHEFFSLVPSIKLLCEQLLFVSSLPFVCFFNAVVNALDRRAENFLRFCQLAMPSECQKLLLWIAFETLQDFCRLRLSSTEHDQFSYFPKPENKGSIHAIVQEQFVVFCRLSFGFLFRSDHYSADGAPKSLKAVSLQGFTASQKKLSNDLGAIFVSIQGDYKT